MDFALTANQESIRDAVGKICARFDDAYWLKKDREGGFPSTSIRHSRKPAARHLHSRRIWRLRFGHCRCRDHDADDFRIRRRHVRRLRGASECVRLNPVVVFGTKEQCKRMLPPIVSGTEKACFAVTEPIPSQHHAVENRAVRSGDKYVVNGQKVWISTAQVAEKILLLARTTPLEEVKRPTHGLSLFYTDFDRSRIARGKSRRWAARRSTPTSSSSRTLKFQLRIGSARRAAGLSTSCTA